MYNHPLDGYIFRMIEKYFNPIFDIFRHPLNNTFKAMIQ